MNLVSSSKKKLVALDGFDIKIVNRKLLNEKKGLIVVSNYYEDISKNLINGCKKFWKTFSSIWCQDS